jgi:hypothetical protein
MYRNRSEDDRDIGDATILHKCEINMLRPLFTEEKDSRRIAGSFSFIH